MCYVTMTELKNDLAKYVELSSTEDVYITKNNKVVSVLCNSKQNALRSFFEFADNLPKINPDYDYDKIIYEEIKKKCTY